MPTVGEFDLIARIRRGAPGHPDLRRGIGDDCAVLSPRSDGELLITTDMLMDGRHFRLEACGPEIAGYKAMAVNLSDIAAMAGRPVAAFVAVALPRGRAVELAEGLFDGIAVLAEEFGVALAGGDTNAWDGPLVVTVTLVGEATSPGPVLRSGARPGDLLWVTGPLGGSLRGRHLFPRPRITAAIALHRAVTIHAMIDLSDGLASDLGHLLDESGGLGAVLDADRLPIHQDAFALSDRDGRTPLDHALADGEDFELCLAVGPEDAARLAASPPDGCTLYPIGVVTSDPGIRLRDREGRIVPVARLGFDHLAG